MTMPTGRPVGRPANVIALGVSNGEIPTPPRTINTKLGKDTWTRIWDQRHGQLDPSQDYFIAVMICEATQDIARMRAELKKMDDTLWINNETNLILHPYVKQINELQTKITAWLASFGFSPADRKKLEVVEAAKPNDKFAELKLAVNGGRK